MQHNFKFNYSEQVFCFEGKKYRNNELLNFKQDLLARNSDDKSLFELLNFLEDWFSDSETIMLQTSGSTGDAKSIKAKKAQMMQSAKNTCSFFSLSEGQSVLLCMPLQFIGAKMIVVRALIAGLDLYVVPPSSNPMKDIDFSPHFVAMTPQQASECLKNDHDRERLQGIKHLLLGGMAVNETLQAKLDNFPNNVWLGYGMTETLSHIGLRRLNGTEKSEYYTPFKNVSISLSENDTVVIKAPAICDEILTTNDIAELLEDGRFKILGRADNIVNSGGIKIQIEEVENILAPYFDVEFQLSSIVHNELGHQLVILTDKICEDWKERCLKAGEKLSKHKTPKKHILVEKLPLTASGKPDRHNAKILADKNSK